ncbi:indole-3-acetic acid-induced protein ARG7-like [Phragmites australis]|uniref:indole-3-acetic acid-induced protein ARG7-like n=1 Tax=Phragmites australis TaxID=29695 RepID=UPI002D77463E|nr:indole-3-acetic acid-induced protein ARG7-like [Phragmites australis]
MAKCSGKIRYIVWLRQTLRRWRSRAAARAAVAAGEAVVVPAGHVAVCVGGASRRFVVRAAHLNHPVFRELLRQAEEEYGFPSGACAGPIALPCDEGLFEHVLRHLSSPSKASRFVTLDDLKSGALSCCSAASEALPLLHGIAADKAVW